MKRTLNTPFQVCLNHCHCSILYKNFDAVYKSNVVQGETFTTDWHLLWAGIRDLCLNGVSMEVSSLCSPDLLSWHQRVTLTSLTWVLAVQASNTCICCDGDSAYVRECEGCVTPGTVKLPCLIVESSGKKYVGNTVLNFWQLEMTFKEQEQEL